MQITGKLVDEEELIFQEDYKQLATVELPPVDHTKLEEDSYVLVKCKVRDIKFSQKMFIALAHKLEDIVYYFPSPEKPSEAKERFEEERQVRLKYQGIVYQICRLFDTSKEKCTVDIVANKVKEILNRDEVDKELERLKPEIKLPEKLEELYPGARKIVDTLNLLIDAVREIERRGK